MRVYLHYGAKDGDGDDVPVTGTEDGRPNMTIKLKLPKKWLTGPVSQVLDLFIENFNKKHGEKPLDAAEMHLQTSKGRKLAASAIVEVAFDDREDINVCHGAPPAAAKEPEATGAGAGSAAGDSKASGAADPTLLRCRNYGCNAKFREADNSDTACRHHSKPPVFHETKKGWSCCSGKSAYDWDEFMKIEGCTWGRHSTKDPGATFAASPTIALAEAAEAKAPAMMSAEEYAAKNAHRPSAAKSMAKTVAGGKKRPATRRTDGKADCLNHGCGQTFVVADNSESACVHHTAGPVFHDGGKFWSCCPDRTAMEFDAFLAIRGCTTGPHIHGWEEEDAAAAKAEA